MAQNSLYLLSTQVRKIVLLALSVILLVLAIDTAIKFLNSPANPFFPITSLYLDPNDALGSIPSPNIPTQSIDDASSPTFSFEGVFPEMPDSAFVYRIEKPREKLDTIENAVTSAATLGFSADYTEGDSGLLSWENSTQSRSLEFDRNLHTWRMRTQYFVDAEAAKPKSVSADLDSYASKGRSILSTLGFSEPSLTTGVATAQYAKLGINGLFTNPLSASSADYVTIDVYRKLDMSQAKLRSQIPDALQGVDLPEDYAGTVYKSDPRIGSAHMVVTGEVDNLKRDVYEFDFTDYEYNYNYGIYAVLTPQEAWNKVQLGGGALVLIQSQTADYFSPSPVLNVT
ncbi:hypothetical protein KC640_00240, partial [Candidatus Dojkabacteria bacterium]|nr:hypothetical protein [Candidatus Dojkabacteria bacterium]